METHTGTPMKKSVEHGQVLDGSDIMELVENEEVFSNFVDHKFQELDRDRDGKLSVKELILVLLPAQGSSPDSDHIYLRFSHFSNSPLLTFPL
uniref:EF-hand domain-containing protein n=1 Tax=Fagus sylvatica TaxID=28930 RepID=A0A2N9GCI6_FAGSY